MVLKFSEFAVKLTYKLKHLTGPSHRRSGFSRSLGPGGPDGFVNFIGLRIWISFRIQKLIYDSINFFSLSFSIKFS